MEVAQNQGFDAVVLNTDSGSPEVVIVNKGAIRNLEVADTRRAGEDLEVGEFRPASVSQGDISQEAFD